MANDPRPVVSLIQLVLAVAVFAVAAVGAWYVYSGRHQPTGSVCQSAEDCASGLCVGSGVGTAFGTCRSRCTSEGECPTGTVCDDVAGERGCVPAPTLTAGSTCSGSRECLSGTCFGFQLPLVDGYPPPLDRVCVDPCGEGGACAEGFACAAAGGDFVCAPDRILRAISGG